MAHKKTVTKTIYVDKWTSEDGSVWDTEEKAEDRDNLLRRIKNENLCNDVYDYIYGIYKFNSYDVVKWVNAKTEEDIQLIKEICNIHIEKAKNFEIFQYNTPFLYVYEDPGEDSLGPGRIFLYTVEEVEKNIKEELDYVKEETRKALLSFPKGE